MTNGYPVILTVEDANGLVWILAGVVAEEAMRPGGQVRPTSLVLKPGARVTAIKVVTDLPVRDTETSPSAGER